VPATQDYAKRINKIAFLSLLCNLANQKHPKNLASASDDAKSLPSAKSRGLSIQSMYHLHCS
jgi:hypothetical protein